MNLKFDLQNRLVKFSAEIITSVENYKHSYASEHLLKQLIRSSSSAALNYGEAQAAESKRDFKHKLKVCLKELRESQVNLQILKEAKLVRDKPKFERTLKEINELVAIFTSSVKTLSDKL